MNIVDPSPGASTSTAEDTLFPGFEPTVRELRPSEDMTLSAGRRLTLRQAEMVEDGIHPLTRGPLHALASRHRDADAPRGDPFTCGSCYFRETWRYHGKPFVKCAFGVTNEGASPRISHGPATDVRAWWPACPDYSPGDTISPDAARSIPCDCTVMPDGVDVCRGCRSDA